MKLPDSIRIGGVEYAVLTDAHLNNGANMLYGQVLWEPSEITIRDGMGHQRMCITMWHEIVHALLHHACVDLEDNVEERIAEALGFGLYQVLQDNGGRFFDLKNTCYGNGAMQ